MANEGRGPNHRIGGGIAWSPGVDTLDPSLVFAPPQIATSCHVDPVLEKDGHAEDVTGAFAAVAVVSMHLCLGSRRVEIAFPSLFQGPWGAPVHGFVRHRLKG